MRKTLIAIVLSLPPLALAQVSTPSIAPVSTSPAGVACTANTPLKLLVPAGILFTCQGGVYASTALGPSAASLVTTTSQAFNGPITAPQINGEIEVGGAKYTTLAAAYAAASAASATSDQTIRLGPGTYPIAAPLTDPDNGNCINMYGSGQNSTIIQSSATMTNMYSKGTASKPFRCNIQDLTWDANGFATNALNIQTAKGWTIERNRFRRIASGGEAVVLGAGSFGGATLVYEMKLLNNTCSFDQPDYPTNNYPGTVTTPLNCIHAYGTAYDNTYAFNVGWNHQHAGIVTTGGDAQIIANHFYTFPVTGANVFFSAYGMDLGGGDVVMGNTFDTYGTAGIFFNGNNINVKGNIFECTAGATYCTGLFAGVTTSVQDNITFTDNQITGICGLTEFSIATPINWSATGFKPTPHSTMHDNVGTDCNATALQFHQSFLTAQNSVGQSPQNAGWSVVSPFGTAPTIVAQAIGGQTSDLYQAVDNTGNVLAKFTVQGILGGKIGTVIVSASTISPTSMFVHVNGATPLDTISTPTGCATSGFGCVVTLIPDAGSTWTTTTAGNIAIASTAVAGKALIMTYDPATVKWYPSY